MSLLTRYCPICGHREEHESTDPDVCCMECETHPLLLDLHPLAEGDTRLVLDQVGMVVDVDGRGDGGLVIGLPGVGCPYCGTDDCYCCDPETQKDGEYEDLGGAIERLVARSYQDGIESLVLAHACAGLDVVDARYQQGIQTALDALENDQ